MRAVKTETGWLRCRYSHLIDPECRLFCVVAQRKLGLALSHPEVRQGSVW